MAQSGTTQPSDFHEVEQLVDPCADWGPTQSRALAWFFGAIILGGALAYVLSGIDRKMYDNNGEYFDMAATRGNRAAQATIANDSVDSRMRGDYVTAVRRGNLTTSSAVGAAVE